MYVKTTTRPYLFAIKLNDHSQNMQIHNINIYIIDRLHAIPQLRYLNLNR